MSAVMQQTVAELLTLTENVDELPFHHVRELLGAVDAVDTLARRLLRLRESVARTTAPVVEQPPAVVAPVPKVTPAPAVRVADDHEDDGRARWTLREEDIEPGIVSYFDCDVLNTDDKVSKPRWLANRIAKRPESRPCICVRADDDGTSLWITLSSQYREGYLKMKPDWVNDAGSSARLGTGWATSNYYAGSDEAFVTAAAQVEHPRLRVKRPRLTAIGLKAVLEFAKRSGLNV